MSFVVIIMCWNVCVVDLLNCLYVAPVLFGTRRVTLRDASDARGRKSKLFLETYSTTTTMSTARVFSDGHALLTSANPRAPAERYTGTIRGKKKVKWEPADNIVVLYCTILYEIRYVAYHIYCIIFTILHTIVLCIYIYIYILNITKEIVTCENRNWQLSPLQKSE